MKLIAMTFLAALTAAAPAHADSARAMIEEFFAGLDTLSADFTQTVTDEDGRVLEESGGRVYLALPARFRWDYETPYEQVIVADGERVWLYDVELEQVTVRQQREAARNSPMMVLADTELMDRHFDTRELGEEGGLHWLRLLPRDAESEFVHLDAAVDGDGLRCLLLEDRFGQQTELLFENRVMNEPLDEGRFEFTPPEGVDVIGDAPSGAVSSEPLQ